MQPLENQPDKPLADTLQINADFSRAVQIVPETWQWQASPVPGVERMMLDRVGGEVARATSLVRYAPNSRFPRHSHGGGEEILVLEGQFGDDQGVYPAGTYIRNPVGSSHAPEVGPQGALILVKLHQFDPRDQASVVIDTRTAQWLPGLVDGLQVLPLHQFEHEHVALVRWAPNTQFKAHQHWGGEEILVLEGTFHDEHGHWPAGSWLRSPHLSRHTPYTDDDGALIYVKTGHLQQ